MTKRSSLLCPWVRLVLVLTPILTLPIGCGSKDETPETDEAMKRALVERVDKDTAAEYFTYRKGGVYDYFDKMDAIVEQGNKLPDQLLDLAYGHRPPKPVDDVVLTKSPQAEEYSEVIGRNTWMAWCGGNEGFWDYLANDSLGFIDLLKLVDSRKRSSRFADSGMINEPGMRQSIGEGANPECDDEAGQYQAENSR